MAAIEKSKIGLVILGMLVLGGVGGIVLERWVLPYLGILNPQAPIVITRREEVRINEGINQTEVANRLKASLVRVYWHEGPFGSAHFRLTAQAPGAIVSSDGVIVTPGRTFRSSNQITVLTSDNQIFKAEVQAADNLTGLLFLKIPGSNLPVVKQGFSREINSGERLIAVWPGSGSVVIKPVTALEAPGVKPGLTKNFEISQLNAEFSLEDEPSAEEIGAVIANKDGMLVGYITQVGKDVVALSAEDLKLSLDNFFDDRKIVWPSLDLTYQILAEAQTRLLGLPQAHGVLVKSSGVSGIGAGDFIFAVDGRELSLEENFQSRILGKKQGEKVKLKLIRDDKELEQEITL